MKDLDIEKDEKTMEQLTLELKNKVGIIQQL